jgi:hypothetical protein
VRRPVGATIGAKQQRWGGSGGASHGSDSGGGRRGGDDVQGAVGPSDNGEGGPIGGSDAKVHVGKVAPHIRDFDSKHFLQNIDYADEERKSGGLFFRSCDAKPKDVLQDIL